MTCIFVEDEKWKKWVKHKKMRSSVIGWHKRVNCPQIGQQVHVSPHLLAVRFADCKITMCTKIHVTFANVLSVIIIQITFLSSF